MEEDELSIIQTKYTSTPERDIKKIVEVLSNVNEKLADFEISRNHLSKVLENLWRLLIPEGPSIVLDTVHEVPGVVSAVVGELFERSRYQLNKCRVLMEEILNGEGCWRGIVVIKRHWFHGINFYQTGVFIDSRTGNSIDDDEIVSRQIVSLLSNWSSIVNPMDRIEQHFKTLLEQIYRVRSSCDRITVSNSRLIKILLSNMQQKIYACRNELQQLCAALNQLTESWRLC